MGFIPSTNSIQRTFRIKKTLLGTAFTIDRNDQQYIVTARHVVEGIQDGDEIEVWHERKWKPLLVEVVGVGEDDAIDIAVLRSDIHLTPTHPLEPTQGGLLIGQSVAFLGFPFGMEMDEARHLNNGYPAPFVKAGIVSAIQGSPKFHSIWIDAHGNRGFSGGPLLFTAMPEQVGKDKVAGIISSASLDPETGENAGLVRAVPIKHAIEMIEAFERVTLGDTSTVTESRQPSRNRG
ncbi:MAG: S1C family serine protease [Gammaproteobacteria bacterium]|nr:S1C family serine protease [Gammaproteobacteria bacterium]